MLEYPNELKIPYMLAFALNVLGKSQDALRILNNAGLPIDPHAEFMDGAADEALTTYIDALLAVGREAEARELASAKALDLSLRQSWWVLSYRSCTLAQLGRDDEALTILDEMKQVQGLAISPFMTDAPCFRRLADYPRYRAVLADLDARQAALRTRLPMTLEEHGVADVRAVPRAHTTATR
jgi:hypothetical protein